jgi:hypothetical protein
MRFHWQIFTALMLFIASPCFAEDVANEVRPQEAAERT